MTSTPIRPVIRTGLLVNRPSAGSVPAGDGYLATDAGLSVSDGTVWRDLDAVTAAGLTAHEADTTDVHGIADTAALVTTTDPRLTDERTPTAHAGTHVPGAADAIDLSKIIAAGGTLPTLPDPLYPVGALFWRTGSSPFLYRSWGNGWDQIRTLPGVSTTATRGAIGSRPVASAVIAGHLYFATDTGEISLSDGSTTWITLGFSSPDAPASNSETPIRFDFNDTATFTRGGWALLTGTIPTVASGVASPAANETVIVRNAELCGDCEAMLKVTFPGSITASKAYGLVFKAVDNNNFVLAQISTSGELQLWKKSGGAWTSYPTHAPITLAPGTSYWLVARVVRNTFEAEFWTTNPEAGGSPTATRSQTFTSGDITAYGAGVRGKAGLRFDGQAGVTVDDVDIVPLTRPPRKRDVQAFTVSGSWVPPAGALADPLATVRVILVAPGQGGASGARRAAGVATSGGGGGAPGGVADVTLPISSVTSGGNIPVTIPAAGVGAAAVTTDDTDGNNGGIPGGQTVFFAATGSIKAYRSGSAAGRGATSTAGGGAAAATVTWPTTPGAGCSVGTAGNASSWVGGQTPVGGAGGGGIDVGNNWKAGGTTGGFNETETGTSAGGATNGANGANGASNLGCKLWPGYFTGAGGGGGASGVGVPGGNGGNGGNYGGGGGGGGSSQNGFNSGAGGNGGAGLAIIITEWGG